MLLGRVIRSEKALCFFFHEPSAGVGYLDSHEGALDEAGLRRAMGYGTVLASFNVEEFGTERVSRLTREEIDERFEDLRSMTQFEPLPAPAE